MRGTGTFTSPNVLSVEGEDGTKTIGFKHCIIAAGSSPTVLPGMPEDDPRLMDSTGALELADIPERLLVIGGGIIGLEMATVYDALGSKVTRRRAARRADRRAATRTSSAAAEADREALRGDPAGDEGRRASRRSTTGCASASRATARRSPRPTTASCSRSGGGPTAASLGADAAGVDGRRRRLHPRRPPDAHERAAHLRHRRHRRRADARAQGDARGQGRRRGDRRATTSTSTRARSRRSPTPTPRSRGWG